MRVRNFRPEDLPTLIHIQQEASRADGLPVDIASTIEALFADPEQDVSSSTFVITDDDDELNTWGQGGTLDGIEGEIAGYTTMQLLQRQDGYHFFCQGTVLPAHRHHHGGRLLMVSAMNLARLVAQEFEFKEEWTGLPIYFEALFPRSDATSSLLATKCEMQPTQEPAPRGLRLYRREL